MAMISDDIQAVLDSHAGNVYRHMDSLTVTANFESIISEISRIIQTTDDPVGVRHEHRRMLSDHIALLELKAQGKSDDDPEVKKVMNDLNHGIVSYYALKSGLMLPDGSLKPVPWSETPELERNRTASLRSLRELRDRLVLAKGAVGHNEIPAVHELADAALPLLDDALRLLEEPNVPLEGMQKVSRDLQPLLGESKDTFTRYGNMAVEEFAKEFGKRSAQVVVGALGATIATAFVDFSALMKAIYSVFGLG